MSAWTDPPSGMVTFLFTDIEGSTGLAQRLGAGYRYVLNEHRRLLRQTLGAGEGVELNAWGDSFFFAFPDAECALRSCVTAQRALTGHPWPDPRAQPRVRMGLHSGWARPQGGEYATPEVHRAARIAAAAHGGQVLCSAATAARGSGLAVEAGLRDLGYYRLRGFDQLERLYQVVAPGLTLRFPAPRTESTGLAGLATTSAPDLPGPATAAHATGAGDRAGQGGQLIVQVSPAASSAASCSSAVPLPCALVCASANWRCTSWS